MVITAYGSAFGSPYNNDAEEIAALTANRWHPMSDDFRAVAGRGGVGLTSFYHLIEHLRALRLPNRQYVDRINLIGHANPNSFAFAGTLDASTGHIHFAEGAGVQMTEDEIRNFSSELNGFRPRFNPNYAEVVLYGCRAGLNPSLLRALANALGVTVRGFRNRIGYEITHTNGRLGARGRTFYNTPSGQPATLPSFAGITPQAGSVSAQPGFAHLVPDLVVCPNPLVFSSGSCVQSTR